MNNKAVKTEALYAKQEKIHAREVEGLFDSLRRYAVIVLLGLYYFLPWLTWNDRQGILFDLPARKFYIFGVTLWPQDFFYLSWLLIMAALTLFFVTAVAGRLWCGYACPQTVWTEAFVWLERITEGNFSRRIKLDKAPWTAEKVLRKTAKQFLWIGFAAWTGITFIGYFTPINELIGRMAGFELGPWEVFWMLFYSVATYGNAGFLREQVCMYMCPYARFQSAMFDGDTLVVAYDEKRGEPRGGRKRSVPAADVGLGDCTDCNICVQVCPTGIDIRKGLQYECIACASCVDACDAVMDRMNYPRGLISYTTENALRGGTMQIVRPRVVIYGLLLMLLFTGFIFALTGRDLMNVDVIRDRNALYRELPGGIIQNVYTLKVINKDDRAHDLKIEVAGIPGISLETDPVQPGLEPGAIGSITVRVNIHRDAASGGGHDIVFSIRTLDDDSFEASRKGRFILPSNQQAK